MNIRIPKLPKWVAVLVIIYNMLVFAGADISASFPRSAKYIGLATTLLLAITRSLGAENGSSNVVSDSALRPLLAFTLTPVLLAATLSLTACNAPLLALFDAALAPVNVRIDQELRDGRITDEQARHARSGFSELRGTVGDITQALKSRQGARETITRIATNELDRLDRLEAEGVFSVSPGIQDVESLARSVLESISQHYGVEARRNGIAPAAGPARVPTEGEIRENIRRLEQLTRAR